MRPAHVTGGAPEPIEIRTDAAGFISVTWPAAGLYWLDAELKDDKATVAAPGNAPPLTAQHLKSCRSSLARWSCAALGPALVLALAGCAMAPRHETLLAGETMGSAWTVKIVGELPAQR